MRAFAASFLRRPAILLGILLCLLMAASPALAQIGPPQGPAVPTAPAPPTSPVSITIGGLSLTQPQTISSSMQLVLVLTILSLAPSILMMVTCFVRIAIVLGFVRRAIGATEVPPTQVLIALSIFLTFFVMAPTFTKMNNESFQPYIAGKITPMQAYETGVGPLREFMFSHCRKTDLALFVQLAKMDRPRTKEDVPTHVLIPAYLISELKTAFIIGFIIYIPFLIIDMVVSSILLSMGMMMLPPVTISLPFKILLFVLVDGWNLVIGSLIKSF
jgi:flagellar biosynthesis protein FliP